jgi:S1-C subfamily serine protease
MAFPSLGVVVKTKINMGAEVVGLTQGGPAERVGLKLGNIIAEIDGKKVMSVRDLAALLESRTPGPTLRLSWLFPSYLGWMSTPEKILTVAEQQ